MRSIRLRVLEKFFVNRRCRNNYNERIAKNETAQGGTETAVHRIRNAKAVFPRRSEDSPSACAVWSGEF
jgi:hypothetical protein